WDAAHREQAERERFVAREQDDESQLAAACSQLASVLLPSARGWSDLDTRDPLLAACQLVGQALGVRIQAPTPAGRGGRVGALRVSTDASQLRTRRVALRGSWWKGESGPLVGYREVGESPVALLPLARGGYEVWDPAERTRTRVDAVVAASLSSFADMIYRPFEPRPLGLRDLLAFGIRGAH